MRAERRWIVPIVSAAALLMLIFVPWGVWLGSSRRFETIQNLGHFCVFFGLAILFLAATGRSDRPTVRNRYFAVFGLALGLGILTELLQIPLERDASLADLLDDALGAWAGMAGFAWFDRRVSRGARVAMLVSGALAGLVIVQPLAAALSAYAAKRAVFPVIADYRRSFEDYFLDGQSVSISHEPLPARWSAFDGESALRVSFEPGRWPGIELFEVEPDWTGFDELVLDLTNPADRGVELVVRVHDRAHNGDFDDRFNRRLLLPPENRSIVRIPLEDVRSAPRSRGMDLSRVSTLMLFVDGNRVTGGEIYVSSIRLE